MRDWEPLGSAAIRRLGGATVLLLVMVVLFWACSRPTDVGFSGGASQQGTIADGVSDRFRVTTFPTVVFPDYDGLRLRFRCVVENASAEDLDSLTVTLVPNAGLDPYIAAGAVGTPHGPFAIVGTDSPVSGADARGIDIEDSRLLRDEEFMAAAGLSYQDLFDLGSYTLEIAWSGGEEVISVPASVVDPDGLLSK